MNTIPYNTHMEKMVLPEYGRIVHQMIEIAITIADREERNLFAATIVETMKSMTQEKGKFPDDRKYWDHLYVISGGKLDIDSPFGVPEESVFNPHPQKIEYLREKFDNRHYGRVLQKMVREVALMPNSEEKDACVELLADHIKKLLVSNNTENATDEKVYADLDTLSGGNIKLEEGVFTLPEYYEEKPVKNQKRKKNHK